MTKCTLPADINSCPYYNEHDSFCSNPKKCSFQEDEESEDIKTNEYVRQERWYEKYYKK